MESENLFLTPTSTTREQAHIKLESHRDRSELHNRNSTAKKQKPDSKAFEDRIASQAQRLTKPEQRSYG